MHVELIILSCAVFVCWGFIGYVVVSELAGHYTATRRLLLAPIAGLGAAALIATVVNKLGFPGKTFGWPLLATLVAISIAYSIVRRPRFDCRKIGPWAVAFVVGALLVGWPLIVAGTDWISTGNGDMTVYLLGANHFYEHGFYQLPSLYELRTQVDASWDWSFLYSFGEVRSTSQLMLAWFMAVTGFTASQGYMIFIVALHLTVLSTSAALVCSNRERSRVALVALVVVASSANLALGTVVQLIPQDFGLAALGACATVFLDQPRTTTALFRQGILAGIFLATLLNVYPELSPFLFVTIGLYCVAATVRGKFDIGRWSMFIGVAAVSTLVCANTALVGALHFLIWNIAYSSHANQDLNSLFPYYLIPLGLAQGWGLLAQDGNDLSSWQAQACVIAGGLLFVAALLRFLRDTWRLEATAIVAATMLLLFIPLFAIQNGFGLFKLAMYAQPFVLSALTIAVWDFVARHDSGEPTAVRT